MSNDDFHYTSIKTKVACGPVMRPTFRELLESLSEDFDSYPLQLSHEDKMIHEGLYSEFIIRLKGKPEMVEDMAHGLDEKIGKFSMCLHEKLQVN